MKRIVLFSLVIFLSGAATFAHAANLLAAESGGPGLFPIPQPSSTAPEQNGLQANRVHALSSAERAAIAKFVNANGEDELIITRELGLGGSWSPLMGMPAWPAVYRLENGRYVEDSRDFPNYYDTKVLPQLDREIREAEARITEEPFQAETVAVAELTRDKILRVLGRNPVGGLNEAYQWMNSDNPTLMQCAIAAFGDIGGHEKEVCTLQQALPAAITHEIESRNGG